MVNHVSTQLPYALTAAGVSFVGYIIAGALGYKYESAIAMAVALPVTLILMVVTVFVINLIEKKKGAIIE